MKNKYFPDEDIESNDLYFGMLYDRACCKKLAEK